AKLNLSWTRGDWSASWAVQYTSSLIEDCNSVSVINPASRCPLTIDFPFEAHHVPGNHIGATTYHDAVVTYHLDTWNTDLTAGLLNVFDKQPPIAMSAFANSFLPTYYRTPGRFFYLSAGV